MSGRVKWSRFREGHGYCPIRAHDGHVMYECFSYLKRDASTKLWDWLSKNFEWEFANAEFRRYRIARVIITEAE